MVEVGRTKPPAGTRLAATGANLGKLRLLVRLPGDVDS